MRFLFTCFLSFFLAVNPAFADKHKSVDERCAARLYQEQIKVLEKVPFSAHYQMRIYKEKGENPRLVVLLGEVHVKSTAHSELGVEILRRFPVRGLEGLQLNLKESRFAKVFIVLAGIGVLLLHSILRLNPYRSKGSMTDDASSIAAVVPSEVSSTGDATRTTRVASVNHQLEKGHVYGVSGAAALIANSGSHFVFAGLLLSYLFAMGLNAWSYLWQGDVFGTAVTILAVPPGIGMFLFGMKKFQQTAIMQKYKKWHDHEILERRNETMVDNLMEIVSDMEPGSPILVVCGNAHMDGISSKLRSRGFEYTWLENVRPRPQRP